MSAPSSKLAIYFPERVGVLVVRLLGFDDDNLDGSPRDSLKSHLDFARTDLSMTCALDLAGVDEGDNEMTATPLPLVGLETSDEADQ